jgi:hypothetical protein
MNPPNCQGRAHEPLSHFTELVASCASSGFIKKSGVVTATRMRKLSGANFKRIPPVFISILAYSMMEIDLCWKVNIYPLYALEC